MTNHYSDEEARSSQAIFADLMRGHLAQGLPKLEALKDDIYAAIPDKQRRSRGTTWVILRLCSLLVEVCADPTEIREVGLILYENLGKSDKLLGVPIYLVAEYGEVSPRTDSLNCHRTRRHRG